MTKFEKRQEKYAKKLKLQEQKAIFKEKMKQLTMKTYTKKLVAIITATCLVDLQLTYVLAYLGKEQIAETLSGQLCTTILGVAFVYMIRAYFDTKAEHNEKNELAKALGNKMESVLSDAGIQVDIDFDEQEDKEILDDFSDDNI